MALTLKELKEDLAFQADTLRIIESELVAARHFERHPWETPSKILPNTRSFEAYQDEAVRLAGVVEGLKEIIASREEAIAGYAALSLEGKVDMLVKKLYPELFE